MQWIEAYVAVFADDPQVTTDLVADIFFELDVKGVVVDDPTLRPAEGWGKDAVTAPSNFGVKGYFPDTADLAERCSRLEACIASLKLRHGGEYRVAYQRLDEADWAESWKAFFRPERITSHLVVKPTWQAFEPDPDDIVLEIDPGMAFGTGTHPTTNLCLAMIEKYLRPRDRFLDIGTGSGILMIAAARLGAETVCGIDNDEVAVEVARDNLRLNKVDPHKFSVTCGDLAATVTGSYNIVTANILSEVILVLLDDIERVMAMRGLFVSSGIISKNKAAVLSKLAAKGFEVVEVAEKEEWVAIVARYIGQLK